MQILDRPGCQGERAQLGEVSTCQIHGDGFSLSVFPASGICAQNPQLRKGDVTLVVDQPQLKKCRIKREGC